MAICKSSGTVSGAIILSVWLQPVLYGTAKQMCIVGGTLYGVVNVFIVKCILC